MDIKELRDRAATLGSDYLTDEEWVEVIDRLEAAEKERDALRTKVEAMEKQEPVAAQHRFRHPQKTEPNWSIWQPCAISKRPTWTIDSQGYEVEYRQLYTLPGAKGEDK